MRQLAPQQTLIANPSATYCAQIGGTYDTVAGTCIVNGVAYDAWAIYYAAQAQVTPSEAINLNDIISPMISIMMLAMMMGMMKNMMMPDEKKGVIRTSAEGYKYGVQSAYEGIKAGGKAAWEGAKSIW